MVGPQGALPLSPSFSTPLGKPLPLPGGLHTRESLEATGTNPVCKMSSLQHLHDARAGQREVQKPGEHYTSASVHLCPRCPSILHCRQKNKKHYTEMLLQINSAIEVGSSSVWPVYTMDEITMGSLIVPFMVFFFLFCFLNEVSLGVWGFQTMQRQHLPKRFQY